MTLINDILEFTESFAPSDSAASFDNVGLLVGSGTTSVSKALLALDITKEVVEEAAEIGAQLIISHHPVIFNPLKSMSKDSVPYMLAQNSLSALCLHTNLDIAWDTGVNLCLANTLGLENITFYEGEFLVSGKLKEEISAEDFAKLVKEPPDHIRCSRFLHPLSLRRLRFQAARQTFRPAPSSARSRRAGWGARPCP